MLEEISKKDRIELIAPAGKEFPSYYKEMPVQTGLLKMLDRILENEKLKDVYIKLCILDWESGTD